MKLGFTYGMMYGTMVCLNMLEANVMISYKGKLMILKLILNRNILNLCGDNGSQMNYYKIYNLVIVYFIEVL